MSEKVELAVYSFDWEKLKCLKPFPPFVGSDMMEYLGAGVGETVFYPPKIACWLKKLGLVENVD